MFKYSKDNGNTWEQVLIPEGAYEIKALNATIQKLIGDAVTNKYNISTLKPVITIKRNYKVSFKEKNRLANLLGFHTKEYDAGSHESEKNIVKIISINSILIHLNTGSIVNGQTYSVIYSFSPKVSLVYKIIKKPTNPVYLLVSNKSIKDFKITITDQNNVLLNLREEIVTISFHLREI